MKNRYFSLVLPLICFVLSLAACSSAPKEPYYSPSAAKPFSFSTSSDFGDYVEYSQKQLRQHRVFFATDPSQQEQELNAVAPFVLPLPKHCSKPSKGILLVHGLLDSANALKDIGASLAQACYLVYGLLLPGHGTRPADLIRTTKDEWLEAVRFGVRALTTKVDDVSLIGFSLGGALSTQVTWEDQKVRRLILIAPALDVTFPTLSRLASWYRYLSDWVDVDPPYLAVRYQSMPTQAVAETSALTRNLHKNLAAKGITQPVFLILSADDFIIDASRALTRFSDHMPNPKSQAWVYGRLLNTPPDSRVTQIDVFDPVEKVLNFSHVNLTYHPENPFFGKNGRYRECGRYIGIISSSDVDACERSVSNWKGEIATNGSAYKPFERLSYNPHFDEMMKEMLQYLNSSAP